VAKTTGLGQGVGALFGDASEDRFFECDVNAILPNKHQPRHFFNDEDLEELANSIKERGVIQPLILSKVSSGKYELIAGERRLRAAKIAGLSTVPVLIQEIEGEDSFLELALIENIQRTNLNPLEEAEAYKKLIERFGYTQEETARKVGRKRSTIANTLRLLLLPSYVKEDLYANILSEGHARALLRLTDNPLALKDIRDQIVQKRLSVRQAELLIKKLSKTGPTKKAIRQEKIKEGVPLSYQKALENQLTNTLNSRVLIHQSGNRGRIEIEYYSLDDLERLVGTVMDGKLR